MEKKRILSRNIIIYQLILKIILFNLILHNHLILHVDLKIQI